MFLFRLLCHFSTHSFSFDRSLNSILSRKEQRSNGKIFFKNIRYDICYVKRMILKSVMLHGNFSTMHGNFYEQLTFFSTEISLNDYKKIL